MNYEHFYFYNPGKLIDRNLELVLIKKSLPEFDETAEVPTYRFEMRLPGTK